MVVLKYSRTFGDYYIVEDAVSQQILPRRLLRNTGSTESLDVLRNWLRRCRNEHHECRYTLSGRLVDDLVGTPLPTRTIHIRNDDTGYRARLFETENQIGSYAALSHCWGPPDKQPIKTTRQNILNHMSDIPVDSLPNTFRDAMIAAHSLGIDYIWIDSLCIIQDDDADWALEASRMADVYQNACITFSAADAGDSTHGMFYDLESETIQLPFIPVDTDTPTARFEIARIERAKQTLGVSRLGSRAWVTQEWSLSRRLVHFRRDGIIWACRRMGLTGIDQNNDSCQLDYRPLEDWKWDWEDIVFWYSRRGLTYAKDRAAALEGIAKELSCLDPTDKIVHGVWQNGLPHQLLWFCWQGPHVNIKELSSIAPTWSWIAIEKGVEFIGRNQDRQSLCRTICVQDRTITVSCVAKRLSTLQCVLADDQSGMEDLLNFILSNLLLGVELGAPHEIQRSLYVLLGENLAVKGILLFDNDNIPNTNVLCLKVNRIQGEGDNPPAFGVLLIEEDTAASKKSRRLGVGVILDLQWFDGGLQYESSIV